MLINCNGLMTPPLMTPPNISISYFSISNSSIGDPSIRNILFTIPIRDPSINNSPRSDPYALHNVSLPH